MRELFKGFYSEETDIKDILKRKDVRIVFDTNVLLELYKYDEETRKKFFKYLEENEELIWIPYHVALEFQLNRVRMINESKVELEKLKNNLNNYRKSFESVRSAPIWKTTTELKEKVKAFELTFDSFVEDSSSYLEDLVKKQEEALKKDLIRDRLDELVKGRIGEQPTEDQVNELHELGKKRFKCSMPPGNCDQGKGSSKEKHYTCSDRTYEKQYGDLIVWQQTVSMAKDEAVKSVVFVTDDSKLDWWMHKGKKGSGCMIERPELREEITSKAKLDHFYMVDSEHFFGEAFGTLTYSYEKNSSPKKKKVSTDQLGLFGGGSGCASSPLTSEDGFLKSFMMDDLAHRIGRHHVIDWLFELEEIKAVMKASLSTDEIDEVSWKIRSRLVNWRGDFRVQDLVEYVYDTVELHSTKDIRGAANYLCS